MYYNILVVSKDRDYVLQERGVFERNNIGLTAVMKMNEGIALLKNNDYAVIFVDDSSESFFTLLAIMREMTSAPINLTSHDTSVSNRIKALQTGCNDFLFCNDDISRLIELAIELVKNQAQGSEFQWSKPNIRMITYRDVTVYLDYHKVFVDDKEIRLTKKEFEILRMFLSKPQQIFTVNQLIANVWGDEYIESDHAILYTSINRLRKKLNRFSHCQYVRNTREIGYSLE